MPSPLVRACSVDLRPAGEQLVRVLFKAGAEEPCTLHRHADAFAQDRVRLCRRITDREATLLVPERAHTRPDRPHAEPGILALGAMQSPAHTRTRALEQRLDCQTCRKASYPAAPLAEPVPANAASDGEFVVVREDHAAVTAVEREHRQ